MSHNLDGFLISVVLDAETWSDFSGIQILVVYKENGRWFDNLVCYG